jgi:hypothetical protein
MLVFEVCHLVPEAFPFYHVACQMVVVVIFYFDNNSSYIYNIHFNVFIPLMLMLRHFFQVCFLLKQVYINGSTL